MPNENDIVLKRSHSNFWNEARNSEDITNSFHIIIKNEKLKDKKKPLILSDKELSSLPFRRQQLPKSFASKLSSLSDKNNLHIANNYNKEPIISVRTSRSIEKEIMQKELQSLETNNKLLIKNNTKQINLLLKINKGLATYAATNK